MRINIADNNVIIISFPPNEMNIAVQIMKAMSSLQDLKFLRDAIEECEKRMRPRLTLVSHFHYCNKCACEIDDRVGDNFIHITTDTKDIYVHRTCPPLKENRP